MTLNTIPFKAQRTSKRGQILRDGQGKTLKKNKKQKTAVRAGHRH
jgi:co-chaperonin GroES (HSP10)